MAIRQPTFRSWDEVLSTSHYVKRHSTLTQKKRAAIAGTSDSPERAFVVSATRSSGEWGRGQ